MHLFTLLLVCSARLVTVSLSARLEPAPLSDAHIDQINNIRGNIWTAGRNFHSNDLPYVKRLLGVDIEANNVYNRLHLPILEPAPVVDDLPKSFDGRDKWPDCKSFHEIRDQSDCGDCWAFGSAEAMSDRICAATKKNVRISTEDLNSCCDGCGFGCAGGYPAGAWEFYVEEGVVTGGRYHSSQGCRPYSLPPCEHHMTGTRKNCSSLHLKTPPCRKSCITGYSKTYTQDKHKGRRHYHIKGVDNIMNELFTKGSVTAAFSVFSDFLNYKSGVYKHVSGGKNGGHAVRIIGWGEEGGEDYWLVANSWNTDWGDKGFFKIAKGSNECGIESSVVAGDPAK